MTFRPDPKPDPIPKKEYKGINKISLKKSKEKEEIHGLDDTFYKEIWSERPHKCKMCNVPLGFTLHWNFMHHILEKGRRVYEHLRHEKENIIVVCQNCHDIFHSANPPEEYKKIVKDTYQYFQRINKLL